MTDPTTSRPRPSSGAYLLPRQPARPTRDAVSHLARPDQGATSQSSHGVTRRNKRYKVSTACDLCRRRKVKCDGTRPTCGPCQKSKRQRGLCHYSGGYLTGPDQNGSSTTASQGISPVPKPRYPANTGETAGFEGQAVSSVASSGSRHSQVRSSISQPQPIDNPSDDLDNYGGSSVRHFIDRFKASLDARLSLPTGGKSVPVPMTDAPLFLAPAAYSDSVDAVARMEFVLPPRKQADHLVRLYWQRIHPLNPFIHEELFSHRYASLYAGTLNDAAEHLFLGSFNAVLALATQCDEQRDVDHRHQSSLAYFQRGRSFLRPGQEIWETPSLELVECLLLLTSYLMCTGSFHQTWMTIGAAIRSAQGLGLHLLEGYDSDDVDGQRRRRIWHSCIYMDKQISMSYGHPPAVHDDFIDAALEEYRRSMSTDLWDASTLVTESDFFFLTLGLYKLTDSLYHISSAPHAYRSQFSIDTGLSAQNDGQEYIHTAIRIERLVEKWEKSLPDCLKGVSGGMTSNDPTSQRLAATAKLRASHCRIMIFRPMLASFCLSKNSVASGDPVTQGMRQQLIYNCAAACIKNAQQIVYIIQVGYQPGAVVESPFAWWVMVFYMHIAATVLVVAMLRTDLSSSLGVSESWDLLMSLLHASERFTPFIPQYIEAFKTLAAEVAALRNENAGMQPATEQAEIPLLQDFLRDEFYSNTYPWNLDDIFYMMNS